MSLRQLSLDVDEPLRSVLVGPGLAVSRRARIGKGLCRGQRHRQESILDKSHRGDSVKGWGDDLGEVRRLTRPRRAAKGHVVGLAVEKCRRWPEQPSCC